MAGTTVKRPLVLVQVYGSSSCGPPAARAETSALASIAAAPSPASPARLKPDPPILKRRGATHSPSGSMIIHLSPDALD